MADSEKLQFIIFAAIVIGLTFLAMYKAAKRQRAAERKKPRVVPQTFAELSRQIERV